ncbi:hypothetical protein Leryth_007630 [Lithospermum erythrorhizon]|nr:hypothetical protein Leryth_007630 [Lithospermum erythrorhizon]
MAGMLPGVETARRRRVHQSAASGTSTRYFGSSSTSFCDMSHGSLRRYSIPLHATTQEPLHLNSLQRNHIRHSCVGENEKLDKAAREAKERLDERLNALWKSDNKWASNRRLQSINSDSTRPLDRGNVPTEMVRLKKSASKRLNWAKLSWKSSEQEECAVCLEQFKIGETLKHLPCAHRFHSKCLVPWLDTNAHCPCCRMRISIE